MNTQEQAYINGFVKRASEHGFNREQAFELLKIAKKVEDSEYYANPLLNAVSGTLLPNANIVSGAINDMVTPHHVPSRLARITLPTQLASFAGGLTGLLATDGNPMVGLMASRLGGGLGAYLGANNYNDALARALKEKKR